MIIAKLQGGLGNQMFQYATAKNIANGKPVYFDLGFLNQHKVSTATFTSRQFELTIFKNIQFKTAGKLTARLILNYNVLFKFVKRIIMPDTAIIQQSEKNELINLQALKSKTIYLDGYFQNEDYFKNIRQVLLHDFQFPQISEDRKKAIKNAVIPVSVHVRRGDYLQPAINAFHGLVPISYYQQAKAKLETLVTNPFYFVFSDDPEWCTQNFSFFGENTTIMPFPSDNNWEDMYLMSICKHNIIANSSYSWWGAWLNQNADKVVIAPQKWFSSVNTDIIPPQWIRI